MLVDQGSDTGPAFDAVLVATVTPSTLSVKTLELPLAPFTHMTTHAVPLTVLPPEGWVIATCSVPVAAGGAGAGAAVLFRTLTDTFTLPVLPLASRTPTVRVCVPSATSVVFHGIDAGPLPLPVPLPTVLPPAVSV